MTSAKKTIGTVQLFPDDGAIAEALANNAGKTVETAQAPQEPNPEQEGPALLQRPASERSMQDYYKLQLDLLRLTVVFGAFIFPCVWWAYSLNTALNYLVGASTGVVYLRMLARSVGRIGREAPKSNSGRLAILIGVLVVATQWEQLSVLPIFLGFLTYKAALITFVLWTSVLPSKNASAKNASAKNAPVSSASANT
ncbi:MAG: ATP synthase subunit I [Phormidesmis sp.]